MELNLQRMEHAGVAIVGTRAGRVRFGFTERTGGVSRAPYEGLNLGTHVGDDPAAVAENRRRALAALGVEACLGNLIVPNQVHGDNVVVVREPSAGELARVRAEAATGADAIVCTAPDVPVMLCFADCVPVILVCEGAFAVVHSGWKGTIARISAKAARILAAEAGAPVSSVRAFVGPHILGDEYEVSHELMERFAAEFSCVRIAAEEGGRLLDLSACIAEALQDAGVPRDGVLDSGLSTVRLADRFYSYRREGGVCGRHGAIACMQPLA